MTRRARSSALDIRRRQRAIGAAILLVVAVTIFLGYTKPNPFRDERTVRAEFVSAAGVGEVGADVRVHGVRVGRISDRRRAGNHAVLTLKIDADAGPVHRDARAALRPRTAFEGTAFVELDPGSSASPELGDDTLPLARTRTYVALDQALRFAAPDTRQAIRDDVTALGRVMREGGREGLSELLRVTPALTRDLAIAGRAARGPGGDELRGAVNGLGATLRRLARSRDDLAGVVRSAGPTFAALSADGGRQLDRALAILPAELERVRSGGGALDRVVTRLDALAGDLGRGVSALAPTLTRTRPVLRQARPVLARAPKLLNRLRRGVRAAAAAAPDTRRLLTSLDRVDTVLDESLTPALLEPTSLGAPSYLQFINLFQGGGGAFRPFQTPEQGRAPRQSGAGHFVRFSARFFTGAGYPVPPCSALAGIDPAIAEQFRQSGACQ